MKELDCKIPIKVIFLDFDGVINHVGSPHHPYKPGIIGWSPECIKQLNRITTMTDAKIVITSSWRKQYSPAQLVRLMKDDMGITGDIVGTTPSLYIKRGLEIQNWLELSNCIVSNFVILDDSTDMEELTHRLIRTNPEAGGLTPTVANKVIIALSK